MMTASRSRGPSKLFKIALLLCLLAGLVQGGFGGIGKPGIAQAATVFPLKVSTNGHYLVDQNNTPFFYYADTAWMLTSKMSDADVIYYLNDRQSKGFNTIQVMLTGPFIDLAYNGTTPFANHTLTQPNSTFFTHIKWVLDQAASRGMLVVGSTSWFGASADGYFNYLTSTSLGTSLAETLEKPTLTSGATNPNYLGSYNNLIYFLGGDHAPGTDDAAVKQLGTRLKQLNPNRLISYHPNGGTSGSAYYQSESWLDFNMIQTYTEGSTNAYSLVRSDYNLTSPKIKPSMLTEPNYENEHNTTPYYVRTAAYWSMFSGAFGQAYGNGALWNINSASDPSGLWKNHLNDSGVIHLGYLKNLMTARTWYNLVPDQAHTFITSGYGSGSSFVSSAVASDSSFGVAYVPSASTVTVNLNKISGGVTARWFDPTNNSYTTISGSPFAANSGSKTWTSPSTNSAGNSDFVLVLDSGTAPTPTPTPTPGNPAVYEAENGTYAGGGQQQSASNASNGLVVGALNNVGAYSQISNVNGAAGGNATLKIRFANGSGSTKSLSLYINGVKLLQNSFANTGSWNTFADTASISITLNSGTSNTIKLQRDAADTPAADIDKYTVTTLGTTPTPTPTPTPAAFYKGINLNGPATTIDGKSWISYSSAQSNGLSSTSVSLFSTSVTFSGTPTPDTNKNAMLNTGIWCSVCNITLTQASLPAGSYQIYLYSVENYMTNFRSYNVKLQGTQVATGIGTMANNTYQKFGPYSATVSGTGILTIDLVRVTGDPQLSGIEFYH
ncbi:DUF4038 domain-containing protein [Paenibacillus psychroresistens]|uniref:DUF4038 domain-containing protein n=1 Tax=Paenibacillus psychroresistens TaxID=1778678 RepID=A0A6B8REU1_9BACL|nr:DUF4038 domain-containing protein [Paenibacillus psychroresistens]QGQ95011.1 DUF4038 domain-containing protein [Paenibacillus psychroresistens]